ncbi:MAG TPA: amidohydrolase, partial [Lactococcus lactis]|nr:amidohydrolase [Lactococcus lactis]
MLPVEYSSEELEYAAKFHKVGDIEDIKTYESMAVKILGDSAKNMFEGPVVKEVLPPSNLKMGSTDVGDVSWNIPTSWFGVACYSLGTPAHSWQAVAQGKSPLAHKGMRAAATI